MALVSSTLQDVPELLAGRGLAPQVLQMLDDKRPFVPRQPTTIAIETVTPDRVGHFPGEIEGRPENGLSPALTGHAAHQCGLAGARAAPDRDRSMTGVERRRAKRWCDLVCG